MPVKTHTSFCPTHTNNAQARCRAGQPTRRATGTHWSQPWLFLSQWTQEQSGGARYRARGDVAGPVRVTACTGWSQWKGVDACQRRTETASCGKMRDKEILQWRGKLSIPECGCTQLSQFCILITRKKISPLRCKNCLNATMGTADTF